MNNLDKVIIYTDGACKGNPGKGGYGAVLQYKDIIKEINGFDENTTNNRMELMAVIESLKCLKRKVNIELYTDSLYVKNGITLYIKKWRTTNYKNIKNKELWQLLDQISSKHNIEWHWVKSHSAIPLNERADYLANQAIIKNTF